MPALAKRDEPRWSYLRDALPQVARELELELVERAQRGDEGAKRELLQRSYPMIHAIAKSFHQAQMRRHGHTLPGTHLEDIFQDGCFGFLKAINKFDIKSGFRLATYTAWWVRAYIIKSMHDQPPPADLEFDADRFGTDAERRTTQLDHFVDQNQVGQEELLDRCLRDVKVQADIKKLRARFGPLGWDIIRFHMSRDRDEPGYLNFRQLGRLHNKTSERVRQVAAEIKEVLKRRLIELL